MEKIEVNRNNLCFACGPDNPIGLKIVFRYEDGKAKAEFTPGPYHQSWDGVFHGGLLALCLDEAGGYAVYFQGIKALTARMDMRLRKTIRPGKRFISPGKSGKKTARSSRPTPRWNWRTARWRRREAPPCMSWRRNPAESGKNRSRFRPNWI